MLPALAFVPTNLVIQYYEKIEDFLINEGVENQMRVFLNYFEDNYVGRYGRTIRGNPDFQ